MATNPRYANGHRRRTLRARLLATQHTCGICGEHIDKTLHYLDPGAPEVDEIIPLSRGGNPLARSNTRLVHRICNQRRGNKLDNAAPRPTTTLHQPTTTIDW